VCVAVEAKHTACQLIKHLFAEPICLSNFN
jgi:hypothetical protein